MKTRSKILFTILALVGIGAGTGLYLTLYSPSGQAKAVGADKLSMVDKLRPDFSLQDTSNQSHSIKEWDGKVILLNFWATWCPPCRHEIPAFIHVYDKYQDKGFVIVGVALDSRQNAIDFVDPMGVNYPILVAEQTGIELTQAYGNTLGVLPYSVIIDRKGVIRHTISHALNEQQAEQLIAPLL